MFPRRRDLIVAALNGLKNVAGLGDARPVNLGLRLRLSLRRVRRRTAAPAMEVGAHALRFIPFKRTGVGLLFRYPNRSQDVQNFPALYFQLSS